MKFARSMNVHVQIEHNPYGLSVETLYEMAARINKKRSFLFVSKVLGKHIPIPPEVPMIASALLASVYYEGKTTKQMPGKEQLIKAVKDGSPENLQPRIRLFNNCTVDLMSRLCSLVLRKRQRPLVTAFLTVFQMPPTCIRQEK